MKYQSSPNTNSDTPWQHTSSKRTTLVAPAVLDTQLFSVSDIGNIVECRERLYATDHRAGQDPRTPSVAWGALYRLDRVNGQIGSTITAFALLAVLINPAWAGTVSPVQSTDSPYDLDIVAPVQLAGSDEQAADFQQNDLPVLQDTVSESLSETQAVNDTSSITLDPNKLLLDAEADVRVYFIGEGAGYHNTLGYYTGDPEAISSGINNTDAQLIFPDASSSASYLGDTTNATRTESEPLLAGDFVDLGTQDAGTQLNFFLIANGANGGTNIYTADPALNPDGTEHFVSLAITAVADSPYLLIGVEDLYGGGDQDYNDLVFAVDIGYDNVAALIAATVPLPASAVALIGLLGFVAASHLRARRRQKPA